MFSGIIKHTGKINKIYINKNNSSLEILSNIKFHKNEIGSSISCSGTCLTLENYNVRLSKYYISKDNWDAGIHPSPRDRAREDFTTVITNRVVRARIGITRASCSRFESVFPNLM